MLQSPEVVSVATEQLDYQAQLDNLSRHLDNLYPEQLHWKRDHGRDVAVIVGKLIKAEINDSSTSEETANTWKKLMPWVLFAAQHHDIGKLYLGKDLEGKSMTMDRTIAIVNKDGPLDTTEKEILQKHPIAGVHLLEIVFDQAGIDQTEINVPLILYLVASHHRRQGNYPDKQHPDLQELLSQLSPEEAKFAEHAGYLLELADSAHAIMGDRIYDKRRTKDEAFTELCNAQIWQNNQISFATEICEKLVAADDRRHHRVSPAPRFGR